MAKATSSELLTSLRANLTRSHSDPIPKQSITELPPESTESAAKIRSKQEAAAKISVSVYPKDIAQLDQLKDFMRQQGVRNISDSEALRIACRALVLTPDCLSIYQEMQKEDGRRKDKIAS